MPEFSFRMKPHPPIKEIFDAVNTAHLSSLISPSPEPAADIRKWLVANRKYMSPECVSLLNELGVTKKGFALALKRWFSQYQLRQNFIKKHDDKPDEEWLKTFGIQWQHKGGVFNFYDGTEIEFTSEEIRQAHKMGVITAIKKEGGFELEVLVSSKQKLNPIVQLLDQCAIPIVKLTPGGKLSVVHVLLESPTKSEFNQLVKTLDLPLYAQKLINGN